MWDKNGIYMDNIMYIGTSFFGRRGKNEVEGCDVELLWWVI